MDEKNASPKIFISYSWSSPEHQQWVVDLAEQLVHSGVDVVLDKWDLKEGHDIYAFMEQMVNESSINKVLIISDKVYAEKANGRQGGVGTETLIISPKIYKEHKQEKFIVVIPPRDESGKIYVPTYFEGRLHIDLSKSEEYSEGWDQLLRCVYGQPLLKKPELGKKPAFLDENQSFSLGTEALFRRAIDALRNGKPYAKGAIDEYLSVFASNLSRFKISEWNRETPDEQVLNNLELFLPVKNEFVQLFIAINQYYTNDEIGQKSHRFLENLIPYLGSVGSGHQYETDNYHFIIHELFLYIIAIFIKYERFHCAEFLMKTPYFDVNKTSYGSNAVTSYQIFRDHLKTLEHRNNRLSLNRLSIRADMLKERSETSGIDFHYLMQADLLLFIYGQSTGDYHMHWWPETLVYAIDRDAPFEIFARARSNKYFEKIKCLLGVNDLMGLKTLVTSLNEGGRGGLNYGGGFRRVYISSVLGLEHLCSLP